MTGKVKWFNATKGFGFIIADGQEYFVHFSEIQMDGFKALKENDEVEFEIAPGKDGAMQATKVKKV